MKKLLNLLPLAFFAGLVVTLFFLLGKDNTELKSVMIEKNFPSFSLSTLENPNVYIDQTSIKKLPALINVWATWCIACRVEHPFLMELKDKSIISIYGLNYKERDNGDKARKHLSRIGNPYEFSFFDPKGKLAIDLGVYGAPETFFIDKNGLIKIRHVGPLTADIWEEKFSALLKK